ncbi:MAG: glycoside hydrolase family 104 protein [Candidatus Babeliaceae bacterium]
MKKRLLKIGTIVLVILGLIIFSLQVNIVYSQESRSAADILELRTELLALRAQPAVRAFLDTIAYAEATYGKDGYRTQYTGLKFSNFNDHPRQVICALYKGEQLCSSAAGRYQFLKATWDRVASKIWADDFGPVNQDLAAIELMRESDAVDTLLKGDFKQALERVNKVWASLPGAPYGQPVRAYEELEKVYKQRLREHKRKIIFH